MYVEDGWTLIAPGDLLVLKCRMKAWVDQKTRRGMKRRFYETGQRMLVVSVDRVSENVVHFNAICNGIIEKFSSNVSTIPINFEDVVTAKKRIPLRSRYY